MGSASGTVFASMDFWEMGSGPGQVLLIVVILLLTGNL